MKLSLKTTDDEQRCYPLVKAKIPITVFNLPFTTSVATTNPSALSFSLSTNFPSGPSLKLSTNTSSASTTSPPPLSFSLKSGTGLFGSPKNSPLIIAAHFTLFPAPNINPTFTLQIKPQFGDFSLLKTTLSNPPANPNPDGKSFPGSPPGGGGEFRNGFVPGEPLGWRELTMGSCSGEDGLQNPNLNPSTSSKLGSEVWKTDSCGGIWSGFAVRARTVLPVTKSIAVNCRWGVNFPAKGAKLPFLTVDKVAIERVEEVKDVKVKAVKSDPGDVELLKGMCFWMKRDLEVLEKENREMKQTLEELRSALSARTYGGDRDSTGVGRKAVPHSGDNSGDFEGWKSKKNSEEVRGRREPKKPSTLASDVENELQRAIKAASS